jgi:hypothetical protein
MPNSTTAYALAQTPEAKKFLAYWSMRFSVLGILAGVIAPLVGFILAFTATAFGAKVRGRFVVMPWVSVTLCGVFLFFHLLFWANVIHSM